MALPASLPAADFADQFKVSDVVFTQAFQQQRSATGGGEARYADRAPSLFRAEVTTIDMLDADAEGIMALINSRAGGIKTVELYNYKLPAPRDDPTGSVLGTASPKLGAIADRLHVAFTGFPAAYKLARGTYFSVAFDTSRLYLGQLIEARTASAAGAVSAAEIWPPLPASVAAGADVRVIKPVGKFRLIPGSAYPSSVGPLHSSIKFSAEQTYSR